MDYIITDGHGFLAGKRIYRDPNDKTRVISMWSPKKRDAMRIHFYEAAEIMLKRAGNPESRIIVA